MENLQIIQPSSLLAPYIKQYWFLQADNAGYGRQRVIPSGLIGVSFNRGGSITLSTNNTILPQAYIYGQTLRHTDIVYQNKLDLIVILFKPIGARLFLDAPISEFNERTVALDLFDPDFYSLAQYLLGDTYSDTQCVSIIEQFFTKKLLKSEFKIDIRFKAVFDLIDTGNRDISILAQSACLGYKQFKRLFLEYTGLNPKDYLRVSRCSHLLNRLQSESFKSLDDIAFDSGYYDKSHLIKEIKIFTNYTPTEYLANCDSFAKDKLLFQTIFVENN